ncbi:MAG: hypothetical protein A2268_00255 [Candidatus Raymondbacteria bacterium RifOxyA12_full_50_37]|nr:MAG: hypothetical protein A2268_00255 [Candidatus Raymondbacteria bacterium RifOxyA12_full_50_37]OGJ92810.1 MAG: hypothetical protein A2248_04305 [Candidatus Raymondbacteria bacterium RIFOXYA2_FULL_49_16]OGK04202.1 MAG: hypothetical protein A2350_02600 [Candidatus Raymondbacteria bacterium RifOxyB12_full_50_8]OGK04541.1 MAG: hypothetical protein A2487_08900 [Candidatus Raymondbacteria bacterium RifOxyC12_full_50_8]OGP44586.1 MAG: hypothetical protein A2324_10100 [Candidatus Raymondbacteria b
MPNFRLWAYSPSRRGVFGDGKVRLLRAIESHGSLQSAARALGISYRKAWDDLKKAEACLDRPLIKKNRGGRGGGGTALTEYGKEMVLAFEKWRRHIEVFIEREFDKCVRS